MSEPPKIAPETQNPRGIQEMRWAVRELLQHDSVEAIPYLARIDRAAPGWITTLVFGLLRLLPPVILLGGQLLAISWLLPRVFQACLDFVEMVYPRWSPFWFVITLAGAALLLYLDRSVHRHLVQDCSWPDLVFPPLPVRLVLRFVEHLVQGLMLVLIGSLAALAILPMTLFVVRIFTEAGSCFLAQESLGDTIRSWWWLLLSSLLLLGGLVFLFLRQPKREFLRQIGPPLAALGMLNLLLDIYRSNLWWGWLAILLLVMMVYQRRWWPRLAAPSRWSYQSLRDALYWIAQRADLCWRLGAAVRSHRHRNQNQTASDGWATICQEHLIRLESTSEKLAYRRKITFYRCPICGLDNHVFTGVECLALYLDENLKGPAEQRGPILLLNGLEWLRNPNDRRPIVFDALVVDQAADLDVEELITAYTSSPLAERQKPLSSIPGRICSASPVGRGPIGMLRDQLNRLEEGYDMARAPNPCGARLRTREAIRVQRKHFGRAATNLARMGAIAIVCLTVAAAAVYYAWRNDLFRSEDQGRETSVVESVRDISSVFSPTPKPAGTRTIAPSRTPSWTLTPAFVLVSDKDNMTLRLVPAGSFYMGNANGQNAPHSADEYPEHRVYVNTFYIDAYPVSNAQYRKCVAQGACSPPQSLASQTSGSYHTVSSFDDYPVIKVSWYDAQDYCAWVGGRLPTEAEWEKAARWDPDSRDTYLYPWGNQQPDETRANYNELVGETSAVGSLPLGKSPIGAYDMAGNVWEWVGDWYQPDYYEESGSRNPTGPADGWEKVLRGGGWTSPPSEVRSTARFHYAPTQSRFDTGFRCVLDITP